MTAADTRAAGEPRGIVVAARALCALACLTTTPAAARAWQGAPWSARVAPAAGTTRDEPAAARAIALARTRAEYEQAAAEYDRSRELHRRRMLSDAELAARRLDAERARLGYWEEALAGAGAGAHVTIERAAKRRSPDGRSTVRVVLRSAAAAPPPAPPPLSAVDGDARDAREAADAADAADAELRRLVGAGELRDVFVSLKADPGPNGATISSPYERRIPRLRRGERAAVDFRLFRDVSEVVVSVAYGERVEERRVVLERDGGAARFAVQSAQLSQEADLGAQALFDLRIQRLGADGAARLAIADLPAEVAAEFRDPESKARLTQIRFQEGEDERRLQLVLTLPQATSPALRADVPLRFVVLATDAAAEGEGASAAAASGVGRVALEVIPRGLPRVELRVVNLYHEIAPDDSVVTEVVVRNSGSRRLGDLRLRADAPPGWRAALAPASLGALAVDAERPVRLVLRPPRDAAVGDYEARLRVESSAADRRLATEDKVLRVHVADRGTPAGSLAIAGALVALAAVFGVVGRKWMRR